MNENKSSKIHLNLIYNVLNDVFKKWQVILFVSILFATCFDTFQTLTYQPIYRCEATFAVKSNSGSSSTSDGDIGESFKYIFQSNLFKKKIAEHMEVESLNGTFHASMVGSTSVLVVYAESTSVKTSYDMMVALKENYKEISSLVVGSSNIDVLKDISVPRYPVNMVNHKKNLGIMGIVGFILSFGFFACISLLRNTIKYKDEIETKLNIRLIGDLPKESKIVDLRKMKKKKAILISQYSTSFHYVESMKRIRSYIERYCKKHKAKVLMMTSSLENEGKSSVVVNLAFALAMNDKKVCLIDGDLRKSSLYLILEQPQTGYDINDVLVNHVDVHDALVHSDKYGIDVLFGFNRVEYPDAVIDSNEMYTLFETLRNEYDYILVDSAPSRYLSDSRMMSHYMDGIIMVVKQNHANVSTIMNAIEKLSLSTTPIIGGINNQSFSLGIGNSKYYGYRYGHSRYYRRKMKEDEE